MRTKILVLASILALGLPAVASAQGVVGGANEGAQQGSDAAGPVGGVVGGAVGAVTGGINGLIGIDLRPRFRKYVVEEHVPSVTINEPVAVGTVLPSEGVTYYEVPREYGVRSYRYTMVNGQVVLVQPDTRRIVQVIE